MSSPAVGMRPITDTFGRPLASLRVSVTDRCNLRCQYCMPEEEYVWLPRDDLLTFEEIRELVATSRSSAPTRCASRAANRSCAETFQPW